MERAALGLFKHNFLISCYNSHTQTGKYKQKSEYMITKTSLYSESDSVTS
jgi:hypothetical protein